MAKANKSWYNINLSARISADEIKALELKLPDLLESLGISEYNGPTFENQSSDIESEV